MSDLSSSHPLPFVHGVRFSFWIVVCQTTTHSPPDGFVVFVNYKIGHLPILVTECDVELVLFNLLPLYFVS